MIANVYGLTNKGTPVSIHISADNEAARNAFAQIIDAGGAFRQGDTDHQIVEIFHQTPRMMVKHRRIPDPGIQAPSPKAAKAAKNKTGNAKKE